MHSICTYAQGPEGANVGVAFTGLSDVSLLIRYCANKVFVDNYATNFTKSEDMSSMFIRPLRNTSDLLARTSDNYLCALTLCTSTDSGAYRYSPPPQQN